MRRRRNAVLTALREMKVQWRAALRIQSLVRAGKARRQMKSKVRANAVRVVP